MQPETASRLLGNLICCRCTVQDDLGKDAVCSSADAASEVCTDLPGDQVRVRSLRGEDQVDPKGTALSGDHGQFTFDLTNQLLLLCRKSCLVQQLSNLIASENTAFQRHFCGLVIFVQVGACSTIEELLTALQFLCEACQQFEQIMFLKAHPALPMPFRGEIYAAFEIGNVYLCTLAKRLHKQQFQ